MINSNVLGAVGEALQAHNVTSRPDEQMADTVARALNISGPDAERWLEALNDGLPVEEANRRAGIVSHTENESLLVAIARSIGKALGSLT